MEYSSSYSEATESLWFYSKDEETNFNEFKSFMHKAKLLRNTNDNGVNGMFWLQLVIIILIIITQIILLLLLKTQNHMLILSLYH